MFWLFGMLIYGLVIGLISKAIHPGDDPVGCLPTIGIGVAGRRSKAEGCRGSSLNVNGAKAEVAGREGHQGASKAKDPVFVR